MAKISEEDLKRFQEAVRKDLEMEPEDWSKQDCDDYRAMGYRLPPGAGKNRKVDKA